MDTVPLFEARVLRPLMAYLDRHGANSEAYLNRSRIPGELIASGGPISRWQEHRLLADIVRREGHREALFAAYLDLQLADLGPLASAMASAKTVKESLDIAVRLAPLAYERHQYSIVIEGNTVWLNFRDLEEKSAGDDLTTQLTLAAFLRVLRLLTGEDSWRPETMRACARECHAHVAVRDWENCRAICGSRIAGLAFPTEFLTRRLAPSAKQLEVDPARVTRQLEGNSSKGFVDSLQRLVASQFDLGRLPTVERLEQITGVSRRTIHRRLRECGITYQRLLDRIRFDAACEMLFVPDICVRDIACELGYSGTNNFVRAFRRMTGVTPGEYRRRRVESAVDHSQQAGPANDMSSG